MLNTNKKEFTKKELTSLIFKIICSLVSVTENEIDAIGLKKDLKKLIDNHFNKNLIYEKDKE